MNNTEQMREALTNGAWYWVRYESLNGPIEAPAQYRADAEAFYSAEFSGIPTREVTVLRALTAPAAEVPEAMGSGASSDHDVLEWARRHDIKGTLTDLRCMFDDAASAHLAQGGQSTRLRGGVPVEQFNSLFELNEQNAARVLSLMDEIERLRAAAVPEGWKLVPVEPTPEMVDAALTVALPGALRAAWTRMLTAAPPAPEDGREVVRDASADDLRRAGLTVAVHNDYRLNGEPHTFWLFTDASGMSFKGEGRTDAEALNQVRAAMSAQAGKGGA